MNIGRSEYEAMKTELHMMKTALRAKDADNAVLRAELAALKKAARLLIITTQPVLGEDGHLWVTEHAIGALAALVGEEK